MSGARLAAAARSWLGTPYQHQASLRGVGCDCLGLLRGVWRDVHGLEPEIPPPYTPDWAESQHTFAEPLLDAVRRYLDPVSDGAPRVGDVLLFRWRAHLPAKHLAIVSMSGLMIHAHDGACVCEVPFSAWWQRHLAASFRHREEEHP